MAFPATTLGALHTLWLTLSILLGGLCHRLKRGLTCLGIAAALDVINFIAQPLAA